MNASKEGQCRPADWPSGHWKTPGSYTLVMEGPQASLLQIGSLGWQHFAAGYYLYIGSALGPGGLAARLSRHLRPEKRLHWHIDYLLRWASICQIGWKPSSQRLECTWAEALLALPGARVVVPRFGASDCRCPAHLIYYETLPAWREAIGVVDVWAVGP